MYILKNAWRSITRSKGRNILIGIILFVIAVSACYCTLHRGSGGNSKAGQRRSVVDHRTDICEPAGNDAESVQQGR